MKIISMSIEIIFLRIVVAMWQCDNVAMWQCGNVVIRPLNTNVNFHIRELSF